MSIDFINGHEALFRQSLNNGISLFCGAGFSVEAYDSNGRSLPVGSALLDEMKDVFPAVANYSKLSRPE